MIRCGQTNDPGSVTGAWDVNNILASSICRSSFDTYKKLINFRNDFKKYIWITKFPHTIKINKLLSFKKEIITEMLENICSHRLINQSIKYINKKKALYINVKEEWPVNSYTSTLIINYQLENFQWISLEKMHMDDWISCVTDGCANYYERRLVTQISSFQIFNNFKVSGKKIKLWDLEKKCTNNDKRIPWCVVLHSTSEKSQGTKFFANQIRNQFHIWTYEWC